MATSGNRQRNDQAPSNGLGFRLVKLLAFVAITGGLLYGILSLVQPQYMSVTHLYIETAKLGTESRGEDAKLVTMGIAALRSKPLVQRFIEKNKLAEDGEYNGVLARKGPLTNVAIMLGISANPAEIPRDQRIRHAFMDKLSIDKGADPQTINISVRSSNPEKSARLANDLAGSYIDFLKTSPQQLALPKAQSPQNSLVAELRDIIALEEAKLANLRASLRANPPIVQKAGSAGDEPAQGGNDAVNNVQLDKEQLSKLVSQHILARADREEAELRAKLVKDMLASTGELNSTRSVLNSGLIQKLLIKRSRMERKVADLEVTLLPSHPQLKRLHREMSALQGQIRKEAQKAVANLEDEAKIAAAREKSLKDSLARLRNSPQNTVAGGHVLPVVLTATIDDRLLQLDELEHAIGDNKQKLAAAQTVLNGQAGWIGSGAVSLIKATIIRRAVAVNLPVFPKKKYISLLGMIAAFFLGLIALLLGGKKTGNRRGSANRPALDKSVNSKDMPPEREGFQPAGGFGAGSVRT